jgi:hypothetical protein
MAQRDHDLGGRLEALGPLVGDEDAEVFGTVGRQRARSVGLDGVIAILARDFAGLTWHSAIFGGASSQPLG